MNADGRSVPFGMGGRATGVPKFGTLAWSDGLVRSMRIEMSTPVSNNGGQWPVWSPLGGELFYVEPPNGRPRRLISVPTSEAADGKFAFGPRRPLFDWADLALGYIRPYDVSGNGQRFLVSKLGNGGSTPSGQIIIVQNWFEALRRLAPPTE